MGAIQTVTDGCTGTGCVQTKETYAYNTRLQPATIQLGTASNASAYYSLGYSYAGSPAPPCTASQGPGDNGNMTGYTFTDNQNPSLSHTATYCYDALNRLTQAIATGNSTYNLTFSYDQYGNMSCTTNASTQGPCNNVGFNTANNRIRSTGYGYDAAGNLTQDPTNVPANTYQWDAEGRMTAIVQNGTTFLTHVSMSLSPGRVDSLAGAVDNLNMRTGLVAVVLCLIVFGGVAMPLAGQHAAPEPEELGPAFHYVPPSARQSVEIGDFYFRRKKYSGALSRYEEAARDDPDYAPAYLGMGKAYEKMGRKREALDSYQKYLDALPSKKQADEATGAHRAIRHLERELNRKHKRHESAQARSAVPEK